MKTIQTRHARTYLFGKGNRKAWRRQEERNVFHHEEKVGQTREKTCKKRFPTTLPTSIIKTGSGQTNWMRTNFQSTNDEERLKESLSLPRCYSHTWPHRGDMGSWENAASFRGLMSMQQIPEIMRPHCRDGGSWEHTAKIRGQMSMQQKPKILWPHCRDKGHGNMRLRSEVRCLCLRGRLVMCRCRKYLKSHDQSVETWRCVKMWQWLMVHAVNTWG